VLGRPVSLDDNYCDLEGDSMTAWRIVSLARAEGVSITIRQLFTTSSLAELAEVATDIAQPAAQPVPASEPAQPQDVPLSPIQRWFFDQSFSEPEHWHQAVLVRVPSADDARLEAALQAVVERHDAFAYRYHLVEGSWVQRYEPGSRRLALRRLLAQQPWTVQRIVESAAPAADRQAPLESGPLAAATIFSSPGEPSFVLLAAHHLIIDITSWHVLLEDLQQALQQTGPVQLPPVASASYASWSRWLNSDSSALPDRPWVEIPDRTAAQPIEAAQPIANGTEGQAQLESISVELPPALLSQAREAGGNRFMEAAAAAALIRALTAVGADPSVRIDLENHGRDTPAELDVSGTVGWFTAIRPVVVHRALEIEARELAAAVQRGLEQCSPQSFGRWLAGDPQRSSQLPAAQAVLNVLGASGSVFGHGAGSQDQERLAPLPLDLGYGRGAANQRPYPLEVFADLDPSQVSFSVRYDPGRWPQRSVRQLLDLLAIEFPGAFES
jgi:hypothetical protein